MIQKENIRLKKKKTTKNIRIGLAQEKYRTN